MEETKKNYRRVPTQVHTRKVDRMVAHNVMDENGYKHINKHDYNTYRTMSGMIVQERVPSLFAKNWRSAANANRL